MTRRPMAAIRERLHQLSSEFGLPELASLAEETKREYHGRRSPDPHAVITPSLCRAVREYAQENSSAPYREIADRFDVNIGRVSEILFGKRGQRG